MDIKIELIHIDQKSVLIQLMELYNYDFSLYEDTDINEYGYYGYPHIDDYWNEDGRFPYLIRVNGRIAGFSLICPHCAHIKGHNAHCIGEFFVMNKYRGKGIGSFVAKKMFEMHKGKWEVLYLVTNKPASKFWRCVIQEYTKGNYKECGSPQDEKMGFLFNNTCSEVK